MQTRQWHRQAPATRLAAGAASLVLVGGILFVLRGAPIAPASQRPSPRTLVFWLPSPPPARVAPAPSPLPRARTAPSVARRAPIAEPTRRVDAVDARARPVDDRAVAAQAQVASSPARAPLRLDPDVIRRANAISEGSVRRLAHSVGEELDSPRPDKAARLSTAVAETAVPDCLAPNAGGSLLSIPVIAIMAVRGKCK